jgi:hypothetical protein
MSIHTENELYRLRMIVEKQQGDINTLKTTLNLLMEYLEIQAIYSDPNEGSRISNEKLEKLKGLLDKWEKTK